MKTFWDELVVEFKGREDVVLLPDAPIVLNRLIHQFQSRALTPCLEISTGISLDVGAGVGRWTSALGEKAHFVVGLDVSRRMLETAKRRVRRTNVDFVVASATALPIRSNEVDFILSCVCLQHIIEQSKHEKAVHEITRVSRGRIVLLESMSSGNEWRWSHYPTVFRPKSKYMSLFVRYGAKIIGQKGVDFLPCYQLLERLRELLIVNFHLKMPLYTTASRNTINLRKAYYVIALFSILFSLPFDVLLNNHVKHLAWQTVLVAEKMTTK